MSYPTTRRYPRTLAQAFPRDHAHAIEVYRDRWAGVFRACLCMACVAAIGVMLAIALVPV